jgi:mRNA interferase RelE/StbE
VIDALADDPRPPGVRALTGHRPYLRVRSGDYRVIYVVDDEIRQVRVVVIGHRRDVYRNLGL